MNVEGIMSKYTEELKRKFENRLDEKDFETASDFFKYLCDQKEKAYGIAMDCLDKILSPELKVFIRNLCYNKLGYPDEPLFYKMFGKYPEVGDKVSLDELTERGIDKGEAEKWVANWRLEENWIEKELIDGKEFFVIKALFEMEDENIEEKWEDIRAMESLSKKVETLGDSELSKNVAHLLGESGIRKTWRI